MKPQFDPKRHQRRSIRLPGYDYASRGAYFVAVCVRDGECLLGQVLDGEMQKNEYGRVAHDFWGQVQVHFPSVTVDAFVIMPNHLHAIVVIHESSLCAGYEKGEETSSLQSLAGGDVKAGGEGEETSPLQAAGGGEEENGRGAVLAPMQPPTEADACAGDEKGEETSPLQAAGGGEEENGRGAVLAPPAQARPTSRIKRPTLGQIVAYYKYTTTKRINQMRSTPGIPFWQRNYWEHVIRSDQALNTIRQYITDNPARWAWDSYNPAAVGTDPQAADLWRLLQVEAR